MKSKKKNSTFYISNQIPDALQRLQLKLNSQRLASEGFITMSDIVEMAIIEKLKAEGIKL